MSSNTTHSSIKSSLVSQSLMEGRGVSVFESTSMNSNIATGVYRESKPGIYNVRVSNSGLLGCGRLNQK